MNQLSLPFDHENGRGTAGIGNNVNDRIAERVEAAFLASAIGDALGAPLEFVRPGIRSFRGRPLPLRNFVQWTAREGGRFRGYEDPFMPGDYTDDTQLMIATARALHQAGGPVIGPYSDREIFAYFELPAWLDYRRGGGRALKAAAIALKSCRRKWWAPYREAGKTAYLGAGGTGAVTRLLPVVVTELKCEPVEIVKLSLEWCVITHAHPRALVANAFWGLLLHRILSSNARYDALSASSLVQLVEDVEEALPRCTQAAPLATWAQRLGMAHSEATGYIRSASEELRMFIRTVVAAKAWQAVYEALGAFDRARRGAATTCVVLSILHCRLNADMPANAVIAACNCPGSDTDSIGALTGALCGAIFGFPAIPPELTDKVQDAIYLRRLGRQLLSSGGEARHTTGRTSEADRRMFLNALKSWQQVLVEVVQQPRSITSGRRLSHPLLGPGLVVDVLQQPRKGGGAMGLVRMTFETGQSCVFRVPLPQGEG